MSEQGKGDMEERIEKLSEEKRDLEQQVSMIKRYRMHLWWICPYEGARVEEQVWCNWEAREWEQETRGEEAPRRNPGT